MKNLILSITLVILLIPGCEIAAQQIDNETNNKTNDSTTINLLEELKFTVVPSLGYVEQNHSFTEANLLIGYVGGNNYSWGMTGIRLGVESNLLPDNDQIIAPKIGFEVAQLIIITRLSFIDYIKGNQSELRIVPEVGLTLLGLVNITYGYGQRINATRIEGISAHRFGVSINFSPTVFKQLINFRGYDRNMTL